MTNDDGDLADFPEVAVVLGGGFSADATPSASTVARARAAAHLAQKRPSLAIVTSGSHGDGPAPAKSETTFLQETFAFFEGIRPGDMTAIDKKYRARLGR